MYINKISFCKNFIQKNTFFGHNNKYDLKRHKKNCVFKRIILNEMVLSARQRTQRCDPLFILFLRQFFFSGFHCSNLKYTSSRDKFVLRITQINS